MYHLFLYICVGTTAALVDFGIFFASLPLVQYNYILASMFAFIGGVSTNFLLCNFFLFTRNNISLPLAYARHVTANICSFIVGLGILSVFIKTHYFSSFVIPKIFTTGILMIFNYNAARYFSFNNSWKK